MVDDSVVIQRLVRSRLAADGFEVCTADDGKQALAVVASLKPDVILLDIDMPVLDGYEVCRRLKEESATRLIPVIFLTAQSHTEDKVRALDMGAVDYVTKPFDPIELRARVRSAFRTKYLLDLLEQKAQIDGLTGLYNRSYLERRLEQEFDRVQRYQSSMSCVMIDIDHFKEINDTYGHLFGDLVLNEVADAMRQQVRAVDLVARYGGEEFVVILPEQHLEGASTFSERLRRHVERMRFVHRKGEAKVTVSIGVASTNELFDPTPRSLLDLADQALYAAKTRGRNRVCYWDGHSHLDASHSSAAEADLP
ncbi:Response regulator PleD [Planctomycetes bacterium Pan216]|uniref:diguanylate cyclase n=1 Tax=Kolteria novifilia TaxID=2527975 RepID=A0A518B1X4_9BACT|nr:Response regulator PleD [Planctomycetes bacterium Pan216]